MPATVDHLAEVAAELAVRVRDEGPDDNAEWLLERLPEPGDWFRLAFMCAVAMPVEDRSWRQMVAWAREGRLPAPAVDTPPRGKTAEAIAPYQHLPPAVIARRTGLEKSTVYRCLKRMGIAPATTTTTEMETAA